MNSVVRPVITEKTLTLASRGWYTFAVNLEAGKHAIASDVAKYYKVKVEDVRTMIVHGKMRRVGKRMKSIQKTDWKKALVKLAKGQTIDAYNQVMNEIAQPAGKQGKK